MDGYLSTDTPTLPGGDSFTHGVELSISDVLVPSRA